MLNTSCDLCSSCAVYDISKSKKGGKAALEKHSFRRQDIAERASDRDSWIRPILKFQEQHQKDRACLVSRKSWSTRITMQVYALRLL